LLDVVARKSDRVFAIDGIVSPDVVAGQISRTDITYGTLLVILRNNGLAAATIDGVTNIVPLSIIRQLPLPVLFENDDSIEGDEWVMRILKLRNAPATSLVPILRPIMPQAGHLAAHPLSNSLLIVDRYTNVQHLVEIISNLDAKTPPQGE
jgi:general secretion pathway protein D